MAEDIRRCMVAIWDSKTIMAISTLCMTRIRHLKIGNLRAWHQMVSTGTLVTNLWATINFCVNSIHMETLLWNKIMVGITLFLMICQEVVPAIISNNIRCPATEEPNWRQLSPVVLVTIHFREEVLMIMVDIKTWIIRLIMIRLDTWEALPTQNKMYKRQEMAWSSLKTKWTIWEPEKA